MKNIEVKLNTVRQFHVAINFLVLFSEVFVHLFVCRKKGMEGNGGEEKKG